MPYIVGHTIQPMSFLKKHFVTRAMALAGIALLVVPALVYAWGEHGHRIVGEVAVDKLPAEMPAFFRNAKAQLAYLNPEPDRWRDNQEFQLDRAMNDAYAPEHFIDMEGVTSGVMSAALAAPNRYAYLDTLHRAGQTGAATGFLPWVMLEESQRLRVEFRLWRAANDSATRSYIEARIINDAGVLGHYVADGSNPHHTTVHHHGWKGPNPNGYATDFAVHARFESDYVDTHVKVDDVLPLVNTPASVIPNLRSAILAYLKSGNDQVERLYQLDKANPFNKQTTDPADKTFVEERLAAGARMLRDIWWTAYVTSEK